MIDWDTPADASALPRYDGPAPGFGELLDAARINYDAGSLTTAPETYRAFFGKQIVAALAAKGITRWTDPKTGRQRLFDPSQFGPRISGGYYSPAQKAAWDAVARIRQTDPGFLNGLASDAELDQAATAERIRDFRASSEALARGGTMASLGAQLVGGVRESLADPQQIFAIGATAAIPFGTALKPVAARLFGGQAASSVAMQAAMRAIGGGVANVAAAAPIMPTIVDRRAEIGEDMDAGDIALELGINFALGAAVEGVQMAGAAALRGGAAAAGRQLEAMSARRQAAALRKIAEARPLTPDEADALAVLDEVVRDIASSPFVPNAAGDAAHGERLTEAVEALESDRPIDGAVFGEPAPVRDEAAAKARRDAVAALAADRGSGSLDPQRIADALDMDVADVRTAMMELASGRYGSRAIVMRRRYLPPDPDNPGPRQFETYFARAPQRQGPVDLLTWLADRGGVSTVRIGPDGLPIPNGHDFLGTMGQRFIPGAGPLFRKTGAPLDDIGAMLVEAGWIPGRAAYDPNNPNGLTEAEVIDLIDRAMRGERIYHPDDWAQVEARDMAARDQDGEEAAFFEAWEADMAAWWQGPEAGFLAEGIALTPELLAEMRPFMSDRATPLDVFMAWVDSTSEGVLAEAEAAYGDAGLADSAEWAQIMEDADAIFGTGEPAASAAGTEPQAGGGPDPFPGDTGEGGRAGEAAGGGLEAATAEAGAAEALAPFDDPTGPGVQAQVESLVHDLRAEVEAETGTGTADAGAGAPPPAPVDPTPTNAPDAPSGPENGSYPVSDAYAVRDGQYLLPKAEGDVVPGAQIKSESAYTEGEYSGLFEIYGYEYSISISDKVNRRGVGNPQSDRRTRWQKDAAPKVLMNALAARLELLPPEWFRAHQALHEKTDADMVRDFGEALAPRWREQPPAPAAPANPLDMGAAVDPAIADRQRLEMELRANAPKRGPVAQEDMASTGLFGQVDAFLTHDGKPTTKADLLAEIDADDAALKAMRDCL